MFAKLGKVSKMFTPKQKQKRSNSQKKLNNQVVLVINSPTRSPKRSPKQPPKRNNSIFLNQVVLLKNPSTSNAASSAASNAASNAASINSEAGVPIHPDSLIKFLAQQQEQRDREEMARRNRLKSAYQKSRGITNMKPDKKSTLPLRNNNLKHLFSKTSTRRSPRAHKRAQEVTRLLQMIK